MALINCPECGREISEKAQSCPNCGCPASEWAENGKVKDDSKDDNICEEKLVLNILRRLGVQNMTKAIIELDNMTGCGLRQAKDIIDSYLPMFEGQIEPPSYPYTVCPECGKYNASGIFTCRYCRHRYAGDEYKVISPWTPEKSSILYADNQKENAQRSQPASIEGSGEFNGIYRYSMFGGKKEVYCPRCKSADCSHYQEQKIIPGKSKTSYTVNLNPLKPFTVLNKKQKVVRDEQLVTENKFICNKCGNIFY